MSTAYDVKVTLTIDGEEQDRFVRGYVDIEAGRAFFDGEPQVMLPEGWYDVSDLELAKGDRDHIEECIAEVAFNDDRDACVDRDEDGGLCR